MTKFKHSIKRLTKQLLNDWEIELMNKYGDKIPTCSIYSALLCLAERAFEISREQARNAYGQYTNQQWIELLKL